MKVLDKMNELAKTSTSKKQIKSWTYANRIMVMELHYDERFKELEKTVEVFIEEVDYHGNSDEHEMWEKFLDYEVVE